MEKEEKKVNKWTEILSNIHPDSEIYADTNCCSVICIDTLMKHLLEFKNSIEKLSNKVEHQ